MSKNNDDLKNKLTDEQYRVTQQCGTEPPFSGVYYDHHEDGMYHCIVCDAPLFSSEHKFDSGSGWPSFDRVVESDAVELKQDSSHGMRRTEVTCKNCGAHLGHVFPDGPRETTGQRFCINSAALNFENK